LQDRHRKIKALSAITTLMIKEVAGIGIAGFQGIEIGAIGTTVTAEAAVGKREADDDCKSVSYSMLCRFRNLSSMKGRDRLNVWKHRIRANRL
jgi:hypothetical protein